MDNRRITSEARRVRRGLVRLAATLALLGLACNASVAEPRASIAMHGDAKYTAGFSHFDYVDPAAPHGGRLTMGVQGTFNSLNPLIYKGGAASGVREYVYESLMARSDDEPFSLYGLIAQSIDVPADRSSATFVIRPEARFSDGHPITAGDVVFTLSLLADHGWPFMRDTYRRVTKVAALGPLQVRFDFAADAGREMPLLIGLMPIVPKHRTDPAAFEQTSLAAPVGSGPYVVGHVEAGRTVSFVRDERWWGRDLPVNRGRFNFDEVRYDYYRSDSALFEAFKAGAVDALAEDNSSRWARGYDFPAVAEGRVVRREFATRLPAGMTALAFNTRRPLFRDRRVREALGLVFNAEWIDEALYGSLYKRTQSYFERSELSSFGVPEDDEERRLLAPYPDAVKPAIADGSYRLPASSGSGSNRVNEKHALELLGEAGYALSGSRLVDKKTGAPFNFEVMINEQRQARLLLAFARELAEIGIVMSIREVDDAQYEERLKINDFDMVQAYWSASLSPGAEQWNRFGSASADRPSTRNYAGVKNPAADAMITAMTAAVTQQQFRAAVRAYDRVLRSGDYVIPLFYAPKVWVAFWSRLSPPPGTPNSGFDVDSWWATDTQRRADGVH